MWPINTFLQVGGIHNNTREMQVFQATKHDNRQKKTAQLQVKPSKLLLNFSLISYKFKEFRWCNFI